MGGNLLFNIRVLAALFIVGPILLFVVVKFIVELMNQAPDDASRQTIKSVLDVLTFGSSLHDIVFFVVIIIGIVGFVYFKSR